MKRFLAGVVLGTVLGGGVLAGQGKYFHTAESMTKREPGMEDFALGYSAGVSDTVQFVVAYVIESKKSYEDDFSQMQRMMGCLDIRGRRLGALRYFAMDAWEKTKYPKAGAAAVLMLESCSPE